MAPNLRKDEKLTAERLREVLDYDPLTGKFFRKELARNRQAKEGEQGSKTTKGYLTISVDGVHYNGHRLAWMWVHGEFPDRWIYHLNGDRSDNRIENLALKEAVDKEVPLTWERLREVLDYDPRTGIFTWKVGTARGRIGAQAGVIFGIGYRYITIDGRKHLAHRLAFFYSNGRWPDYFVDHINHVVDDNRIENLREADNFQNVHNQKPKAMGMSGFRGVRPAGKRFSAIITVRNLRIDLGRFNTAEEAHRAYLEAAQKYYGEFAYKGDPPS